MQDQTPANYKYVFVCGLPRSGTSILGRNIGRLENCTEFKNTGVLEDEGQFLQDVYPVASKLGGAGSFGFDPRAHRTETSSLLTPENIARLRASWHAHWEKGKTICVEKTPGNLIMTRFLQAAFPNSYFVVIKRHPVPVSMASQKWKVDVSSLHNTLEHWLHCHELFEEDKKYLTHLYELSYEDYVQDPDKYHRQIATFIGTRVPATPTKDTFRYVTQWRNPTGLRIPERGMEEVTGSHNKKYLDRWSNLLRNSFFKDYYWYMVGKYEPRFARHGYSLTKGLRVDEERFRHQGKTSIFLGALYCFVADVAAFFWRFWTQSKAGVKRQIKAILPHFVLMRIRQARDRAALNKGGAAAPQT
jgi:hypothetical protein